MNEAIKLDHLKELPGMMAVQVATSEQVWPHTMDARKWTDEWIAAVKKDPSLATDEGTMIAWFANAIMAGYDTAHMRASKHALECNRLATVAPDLLEQCKAALGAFTNNNAIDWGELESVIERAERSE